MSKRRMKVGDIGGMAQRLNEQGQEQNRTCTATLLADYTCVYLVYLADGRSLSPFLSNDLATQADLGLPRETKNRTPSIWFST